ncbi:hypothetical protein LTR78_007804 [Recurvomyces mirabilis]|uniref:Nuclear pore complex protein Nup160 n=1 Tax=Recurvomyces mirabilis TaxID=574656 RepID=A0AAE0TV69_9PEZI|nr:hypothetical protein LTR78_007804 [Recurvomyces mirabilis]
MALAPTTHREVRLTPQPASPSHILHIDTTSQRQSLLRAGSKRTFDHISSSHDEDTYARKHLATEGSLFFRSTTRSPRSILCRLLDDRKVLEIQGVDLVKDHEHKDADTWLTFRVEFKDEVLEKGVQFADAEETDALVGFVLTAGKELITLTLTRDLLTRPSVPTDFDSSMCVRKYTSSFLTARQPYRFHAVSSLELLISLADGGLVRLERKCNESGSQWRETFFSEGGWRGTLTLKGLNPFAGRPIVRYGNVDLDPTAIADMAKSPDATGRIVLKQDLLSGIDDQGNRNPYTMSAEQGRLLQIVLLPPPEVEKGAVSRMDQDDRYAIIVHSHKEHEFKIYDITYTTSLDGESIHTQDLQPSTRLIPPVDELMNTNIWHLEHFHVQPGAAWQETQFWVRARSGALCKTFRIQLDLLGDDGSALDVVDVWSRSWSAVDTGPLTVDALRLFADFPGEDAIADGAVTSSERWLQFLFSPGRFTLPSLETALYMYRKARGLSATSSSQGLQAAESPLQERLTSAVTAKVLLGRSANDQPDYQRYQADIHTQWRAYFAVLSHLHARRHEPIGFAFDSTTNLPWSVCADFVAPIRTCSDFELRKANAELLYDDSDNVKVDPHLLSTIYPDDESVYLSRLLAAAKELRQELSSEAKLLIRSTAQRDCMTSPQDPPDQSRTQTLFNTWNLDEEVTTEVFDDLNAAVENLGGLTSLKNENFERLLDWLDEGLDVSGPNDHRLLARYGADMTLALAREMVLRAENTVLDLLVVVVFVAGGLEEPLDPDFDSEDLFAGLMTRYKRIRLLVWLLEHERETTLLIAEGTTITETVTILEDIHLSHWRAVAAKETTLPQRLTLWTSKWLSSLRLDDEAGWEALTTQILARLITKNEPDLGTDFLPFCSKSSDSSTYIHARLHLLTGNLAQASRDFRSAAPGLSATKSLNHSVDLLLSSDEKGDFGTGKAVYYSHITSLFETLKAYSYIAEFAQLALDHTPRPHDFRAEIAALDRKKGVDSPVAERMDVAVQEARLLRMNEGWNSVLGRLFDALLVLERWGEALGALGGMEDEALQSRGLRGLVEGCVRLGCGDVVLGLLGGDRGGSGREVDGILEELARREMASGSGSGSGSGTTVSGPAYYQLLYALRTQRGDFRGAAEILYEHLQRLLANPHDPVNQDPEDETVVRCYTLLINTLACCCGDGAVNEAAEQEDEAWILAEAIPGVSAQGARRKLVRLGDLRREYAGELDRREGLLRGRFPVVGGFGGGSGGRGERMEVDVL